MKYVAEAVEMTKSECKSQLANRRWNCSTIDKAPSFYNDLKRGRDLQNVICCYYLSEVQRSTSIFVKIGLFVELIELN